MKKVSIGSDHAGFPLKEEIRLHLIKEGYEVIDEGTYSLDSVDYPVYAKKVAEDILNKKADLGVLVCGTGEGISIAANKINGIRCGIGYNVDVSKLLREHNDANAIAFGGRFMSKEAVFPCVDAFLTTDFLGGRHQRRIDEMNVLEKEQK
jgi:ribose 5-phosphate isomerase B